MKRRSPPPVPRRWEDVRDSPGAIIGSYSVEDRLITVLYPGGRERKAAASASGNNSALARLMLTGF